MRSGVFGPFKIFIFICIFSANISFAEEGKWFPFKLEKGTMPELGVSKERQTFYLYSPTGKFEDIEKISGKGLQLKAQKDGPISVVYKGAFGGISNLVPQAMPVARATDAPAQAHPNDKPALPRPTKTIKPPVDESKAPAPAVVAASKKADSKKCKIALTFDDGPHPEFTRKLLAHLKKTNTKSTFFVVGSNWMSSNQSNKNSVKQIMESELFELGHHTQTHESFDAKMREGMTPQEYTQLQILRLHNNEKYQAKVKAQGNRLYFRFPYGAGANDLRAQKAIMGLGYKANIYWNVDPKDWARGQDRESVFESLKQKTIEKCNENPNMGAVILLHDIHQHSVEAAIDFVNWVNKNHQDWEFAHLDELPVSNTSFKWRGTGPKGFGSVEEGTHE